MFPSVKPQIHQLAPAGSCSICYRKLQQQEARLRLRHVSGVTGVGGGPHARLGQH